MSINEPYPYGVVSTITGEDLTGGTPARYMANNSLSWGSNYKAPLTLDDLDVEALWDKMYNHAKKIWVACGYCNSANALGSSTCCRCGAGLGDNHV
ncbi:MAG: hypothetical protein WA061_02555 [Microgenomates group bacterium]